MSASYSRPLRIFLCHASADKPAAYKLYRYLQGKDMDPWLDQEKLLPGQQWQVEIPKALAESDIILVLLSKNSITKEGFVQREMKFALDKALEMPEGRIFLIPVRLEECVVPDSLRGYHWVDLFEGNWSRRLMRSLNERAIQLKLVGQPTAQLDEKQLPVTSAPPANTATENEDVAPHSPTMNDPETGEPLAEGRQSRPHAKTSAISVIARVILAIAVLFSLILCGVAVFLISANLPWAAVPTATRTAPTATRTAPTPTQTLPTSTPDPNLVVPGVYIVGTEISAGIYKGAGREDGKRCEWERLKDLENDRESILGENSETGQFYVEVKETDLAFKTECQIVRLNALPGRVAEYPEVIAPGTYLVGREIQHGIYRSPAGRDPGDSCYWERLQSFTGDTGAIIANEFLEGQIYVEVLSSDLAFRTTCELEWLGGPPETAHPTVGIVYPPDGAELSQQHIDIHGTWESKPAEGQELWLYVDDRSADKFYLVPIAIITDGTWRANGVFIGAANEDGTEYKLGVIELSSTESQKLNSDFVEILELPSGAFKLTEITIFRRPVASQTP